MINKKYKREDKEDEESDFHYDPEGFQPAAEQGGSGNPGPADYAAGCEAGKMRPEV